MKDLIDLQNTIRSVGKMYLLFFDVSVPGTHPDFRVRLYAKEDLVVEDQQDESHFTPDIADACHFTEESVLTMINVMRSLKILYPSIILRVLELRSTFEQDEVTAKDLLTQRSEAPS